MYLPVNSINAAVAIINRVTGMLIRFAAMSAIVTELLLSSAITSSTFHSTHTLLFD